VETNATVRGSSPAETAVDAAGIAGAAAFPAVEEGGPDLDSCGPARPVTPGAVSSGTASPTMPSADATLERSGRPRRLLGTAVAGLSALAAAALSPGLFAHGLPHQSAPHRHSAMRICGA
jgi:hypothetical protein